MTEWRNRLMPLLLCLGLLACADSHDGDAAFTKALATRYLALGAAQDTLPLAQLTSFAWDEVFLFGPYTPIPELARITGVAIDQATSSRIEERDDIHILVFMQQKKLVKVIPVARTLVDFMQEKSPHGRSQQQAVWQKVAGSNKVLRWRE